MAKQQVAECCGVKISDVVPCYHVCNKIDLHSAHMTGIFIHALFYIILPSLCVVVLEPSGLQSSASSKYSCICSASG